MITPSGQYSEQRLDVYFNQGIEQYELQFRASGVGNKFLTERESEALFYGIRLVFASCLEETIQGAIQKPILKDLEDKFTRSYEALAPNEQNTIDKRIFQRSTVNSRVPHDLYWVDNRASIILHDVAREFARETSREYTQRRETSERELAALRDPNAFPPLGAAVTKTKKG